MPLRFKAGRFAKSGQTEDLPFDQSITDVGFEPKLLIITTGTSNSNFTTQMRPSFGWSAGPTENFMIGWGSDDNITTPNGYRRASDEYCLWSGGGNSSAPKIKLKSFDEDGFTLTYDTNDSGTFDLHYIVIGNDDEEDEDGIDEVKAGSFNPNITTGLQSITDVGFQPSIVFFMSANTDIPIDGNSELNATWFTGVANFAGSRNVLAGVSTRPGTENNTQTANYQRTDRCIASFVPAAGTPHTLQVEADFDAMLSNGFRINLLTTVEDEEDPAKPIFYLAVRGGSWGVGSFTQPAGSTGNQTTDTGIEGHIPKGIFVRSSNKESSTSTTSHHRFAFGAAESSTDRWTIWAGDQNGINPTITARSRSTIRLARLISEDTPASSSVIHSECDLVEFGSTGGSPDNGTFTVDWVTVEDSIERELLYVTVGDKVGEGETVEVVTPATEPVEISETTQIILGEDILKEVTEHTEIAENVGVILSTAEDLVTPENLQFRLSGGAANVDPDLALGGPISEIDTPPAAAPDYDPSDYLEDDYVTGFPPDYDPNDYLAADYETTGGGIPQPSGIVTIRVLDDVTKAEAQQGGILNHRCIYIYNNHETGSMFGVQVRISQQSQADDLITIGNGTSPVGGEEQTIADETEEPIGVNFTRAEDDDEALDVAEEIPPGQWKAIWIRREVFEGTPIFLNNSYQLMVKYFSDHA